MHNAWSKSIYLSERRRFNSWYRHFLLVHSKIWFVYKTVSLVHVVYFMKFKLREKTSQIAVHGSWMDLCSDWAHIKLLCMEVGWICVQIGHMSHCCARKLDGSVFRLGTSSYIALQGVIQPMKTMTIKYMDYAATRGLTYSYSAAYW